MGWHEKGHCKPVHVFLDERSQPSGQGRLQELMTPVLGSVCWAPAGCEMPGASLGAAPGKEAGEGPASPLGTVPRTHTTFRAHENVLIYFKIRRKK